MTSFGPISLKAVQKLNERINHNTKSIAKTVRAAQKHFADGINRSTKPTQNRIVAIKSNLFQIL